MMIPPELPAGLFTWPMARNAGVSRRRLDDLVDSRQVRRVLRNVYVRAEVPDSVELRAHAAALVISPFAVLRDRTAAWLWGIDTFAYRELEVLPGVEASALREHTRPRHRGVAGGVRDLAPHDVVELHGVEVTTPLRTALDLACHLSRRDALAAVDAFMREFGLTRPEMQRELVRFFRRRGVVQARLVVALGDPRAESPGESWTRMEMIDRGVPPPELQHWVTGDDGVAVFRLDLAYPKHRLAIEYDGREFHESLERRRHDKARRAWLRAHGWTVVVVTRDDFSPEAVDRWVQEIRSGLRLAA